MELTTQKGVEASVRYAISERFNIGGNYTFTEVEQQLKPFDSKAQRKC